MHTRKPLIATLLALAFALPGCSQTLTEHPRRGAIELSVRTSAHARVHGTFIVRNEDGSLVWGLPVLADGHQTRRLSLAPGVYLLDYEADILHGLATGAPDLPASTFSAALPQRIVVASGRLTNIHVRIEAGSAAPDVACNVANGPVASGVVVAIN